MNEDIIKTKESSQERKTAAEKKAEAPMTVEVLQDKITKVGQGAIDDAREVLKRTGLEGNEEAAKAFSDLKLGVETAMTQSSRAVGNAVDATHEVVVEKAKNLIIAGERKKKNPQHVDMDGWDYEDSGEKEKKALEKMIAAGEITMGDVDKIRKEMEAASREAAGSEGKKLKKFQTLIDKYAMVAGQNFNVAVGDTSYPVGKYEVTEMNKDGGYISVSKLDQYGRAEVTFSFDSNDVDGLTDFFRRTNRGIEKQEAKPRQERVERGQDKGVQAFEDELRGATKLAEVFKAVGKFGTIQSTQGAFSLEMISDLAFKYFRGEVSPDEIPEENGLRENIERLKREQRQRKEKSGAEPAVGGVNVAEVAGAKQVADVIDINTRQAQMAEHKAEGLIQLSKSIADLSTVVKDGGISIVGSEQTYNPEMLLNIIAKVKTREWPLTQAPRGAGFRDKLTQLLKLETDVVFLKKTMAEVDKKIVGMSSYVVNGSSNHPINKRLQDAEAWYGRLKTEIKEVEKR